MAKYKGWGYRGRPFSPAQFKNSEIKKSFKMSYGEYLAACSRNYKKRGKKAF